MKSDYRGALNYQDVGLQVGMHLLGHSNLIPCLIAMTSGS